MFWYSLLLLDQAPANGAYSTILRDTMARQYTCLKFLSSANPHIPVPEREVITFDIAAMYRLQSSRAPEVTVPSSQDTVARQ